MYMRGKVNYPAIVTATVGPRSGVTPGTGKVQLQQYDTVNGITPISSGSIEVDVLNCFAGGSGFAIGKYVWIEQDVNGYYWVVSGEC